MVLTRIPKTGSHFSECALNQLIWHNRNSALTICQKPDFSGLKLSLNVLIYDTYQAGMVAFSYALEQFRSIRGHLMESNPFTQQGEQRRAILVSGKLLNDADGLIWPTGGRFAALSGRRYVSLVVGRTTAGSMPCQKTRQIGQMIPY